MLIDIQKYVDSRELYYVPELCSKIIHSMQTDGSVELYSKEAKNEHTNGLFKLLDELVEFWGWDKSKITINTTSEITEYSTYNKIKNPFCYSHAVFNTSSLIYDWNKEKYYGLFIGRASAERIRAIHNHKNFKHNLTGLSSFNDNLFNYVSYPNLVEYFFHSGQTYKEMLEVTPYSDIKHLVPSPGGPIIKPPYNSDNWGRVYEKIAIEIVCETNTDENSFGASEKVIRPCYYKRPFLLIGSPGFLKKYRELGYKTFDGIIDEQYDQLSGFVRVDRVFEILNQLIESGRIDTLLESCKDILEHNHQWVISEKSRHVRMLNEHNQKIRKIK